MASANSNGNEDNRFEQSLETGDYRSYIQQPLQCDFPTPTNIDQESGQPYLYSLEINLSNKNLADEDVRRMIEKEEISASCTSIDLAGNKITNHSVSMLADLLKKSQVRLLYWYVEYVYGC